MADQEKIPSYEDVTEAFSRIRAAGGVLWDIEHPQRRFILAAERASGVTRDLERIAAYRLIGGVPPCGYYDHVLSELHRAIKFVLAERTADHGNAPWAGGGHDAAERAEDTAALLGIRVEG